MNKIKDKIKITLLRSKIGCNVNCKKNISGLGLRKVNSSKILENTKSIRGMIKKIQHMVSIEYLKNEK